ncbi:cysteine protease ATG4B-like [Diaphorina citri]|uniref:Cysteine protease n=1 Tax=Diaphorina citri TaxID=121845 RepID=A0A3Q0JFJ6_DIACI|nr:cysteine protease ATG4B-like [Diaphorina citri]
MWSHSLNRDQDFLIDWKGVTFEPSSFSGRDWQWNVNSKEEAYLKILKMFEDRRTAPYSIHQIALTGASEGKAVGEWFGPNTVAQVLRKLAKYDDWSSIVFHVALDNTLVVNQVKKLCTTNKRYI